MEFWVIHRSKPHRDPNQFMLYFSSKGFLNSANSLMKCCKNKTQNIIIFETELMASPGMVGSVKTGVLLLKCRIKLSEALIITMTQYKPITKLSKTQIIVDFN